MGDTESTIGNNGQTQYWGPNARRWGTQQSTNNTLFSIGDVEFRNTRNGVVTAINGSDVQAVLGGGRTYVNAGGRPIFRSDGTGSSINAGGVYIGSPGINGGTYGQYNQNVRYVDSSTASASSGLYNSGTRRSAGEGVAQVIDKGNWNGFDLAVLTDRAINPDSPSQVIRAVLEAQSADIARGNPDYPQGRNQYGVSTDVGVDYLYGVTQNGTVVGPTIRGFDSSADLPSPEQLQKFLANQLEDLQKTDPAQAQALATEVRIQFGSSFASGVYNEMDSGEQIPALIQDQPGQRTAAGVRVAPNGRVVDAAAVTRLQERTQALQGLDGSNPDDQVAVTRAALGAVGGVGLTEEQIGQMLAAQETLANEASTPEQKVAATQTLEGTRSTLEAVAEDLNSVDPATREAFLQELRADNPGFAEQLTRIATDQAAGQSQSQNRESNMLTTEQLRSITFGDADTQARYDAAVRAYDDIAKMPVIGPIINMFMESFGMGPHTIIRENAEDISAIGQDALQSITRSDADLANRIPENVRTAATAAEVQDDQVQQDQQPEQENLIADDQEAALAEKLGIEEPSEDKIVEAMTLIDTVDGIDVDLSDGVQQSDIDAINGLDGDLLASISAALKTQGIVLNGEATQEEVQIFTGAMNPEELSAGQTR